MRASIAGRFPSTVTVASPSPPRPARQLEIDGHLPVGEAQEKTLALPREEAARGDPEREGVRQRPCARQAQAKPLRSEAVPTVDGAVGLIGAAVSVGEGLPNELRVLQVRQEVRRVAPRCAGEARGGVPPRSPPVAAGADRRPPCEGRGPPASRGPARPDRRRRAQGRASGAKIKCVTHGAFPGLLLQSAVDIERFSDATNR